MTSRKTIKMEDVMEIIKHREEFAQKQIKTILPAIRKCIKHKLYGNAFLYCCDLAYYLGELDTLYHFRIWLKAIDEEKKEMTFKTVKRKPKKVKVSFSFWSSHRSPNVKKRVRS